MNAPTVSAITVTYQTGPRLHECLYALKSDPQIDEILIVNNGNPAPELAWLEAFVARTSKARLITGHGNVGFGAAVNLGVNASTGTHLLCINPDAVLRRGSIVPLITAAQGEPAPCIVGGKIFDVSGRELRGGRRNTLTLWRALGLGRWTLEDDPPPTAPLPVGAVSGAFFLVSRPDFDQLNGFDEGYFLHVEDVDLCRRAIEAGGSVIYQPLAAALHYTSTSDAPSETVLRHKADSLERYFGKFARSLPERAVYALAKPFIGWRLRRRARRASS